MPRQPVVRDASAREPGPQPAPVGGGHLPSAAFRNGLPERIAVRVIMLLIAAAEAMFTLFLLVSAGTAGASNEDLERYVFRSALLLYGTLLMVGATWFSQRAAMAIGLVSFGCAAWALDPFWGIGAIVTLVLAGFLHSQPHAPRWPGHPTLVPASIVAFAGALTCWFLAGLTHDPFYLVGAVAALAIPCRPPWSWAAGVAPAFVALSGFARVSSDPPLLGIRDPLLWFAVPATSMLIGYLLVPWLIRDVRTWFRYRREGASPRVSRVALPLLCVVGLVLAIATVGRETRQTTMDGPTTGQASQYRFPLAGPLARALPDTAATGINATSQVVGTSVEIGHGYQALAWTPATTIDLEPLSPATWTFAEAINGSGQVVGRSQNMATRESSAFLWQNGQVIALGGPAGHHYRAAWDINEAGQIVGSSGESEITARAALWQDGELILLASLPGHTRSTALAINEAGQIVGVSSSGMDERIHAVLWQDGDAIDLGVTQGALSSGAADINGAGQVVGWTRDTATGTGNAVRWDDGRMTVLPSLPGSRSAEAAAINEAGQVAGHTLDQDGHSHAVLWEAGTAVDLGVLPGHESASAADINESGQIVGVSRAPGEKHTKAVIWDHGQVSTLPWSGGTSPASPPASPMTSVQPHNDAVDWRQTPWHSP